MGIFDKAPDINRLKSKGDVAGLIKALRYRRDPPDPTFKGDLHASFRREAAKALGDLRAVEGVVALIESLRKDPDTSDLGVERLSVRTAAARALLEIGDLRGLEVVLLEGRVSMRLKAAETLLRLGDPRGRAYFEKRDAAKRASADKRAVKRVAWDQWVKSAEQRAAKLGDEDFVGNPQKIYAASREGIFVTFAGDIYDESMYELGHFNPNTGKWSEVQHKIPDWFDSKSDTARAILANYWGTAPSRRAVVSFKNEVVEHLREPPWGNKEGRFHLPAWVIEVWASEHRDLLGE